MALTRPRFHQLKGSDFKNSCRVATASNVTLLGGAPATVDGVNLQYGDRVLVTGQDTASENGIYTVATLGTGVDGTWTRSNDAKSSADVTSGAQVPITEGTLNAGKTWKLVTPDPIDLGTTPLTWSDEGNGGGSTQSASGLAPENPVYGQEWYDTDDGKFYKYLYDGVTGQWVEWGPNNSLDGSENIASTIVPDTDNTYNLGAADYRIANVYATNFIGDGSQLTGISTSYTVTESDVTAHQAALSITESQISDLGSYLTSETNTTLALAGTSLNYTDEQGNTTNISLASFLDDTTNTVSSAALSGNTITFTREDGTTFTLDVTNLYDDTNLVTSVNGQTGAVTVNGYTDTDADARIAAASIGDLSDIDITTAAPTDGEILHWDSTASKFVPAKRVAFFSQSTAPVYSDGIQDGDFWRDTDDGTLYIATVTGTTVQWFGV